MASHRLSAWKTTAIAAVAALCLLAIVLVTGGLAIRPAAWPAQIGLGGVALLAALALLWLSLVTAGGLIGLRRDTLERRGVPYVGKDSRESRLSGAIASRL